MLFSENTLESWTHRSSAHESAKQEKTEAAIKNALLSNSDLEELYNANKLVIYAKGSYANNTNVRLDSDVDIAVEERDGFYSDRNGYTIPTVGYSGKWSEEFLWQTVQKSLINYFGDAAVDTSGNASLEISSDFSGIRADVVPCSQYHYYTSPTLFRQGTRLKKRDGTIVINYPKQQYDNGVLKNNKTGRSYKRTVRIIKRLENYMVEKEGINPIPSFLIESLVYNCPDPIFVDSSTWQQRTLKTLDYLYDKLGTGETSSWKEPNEFKPLFDSKQKWSEREAFSFISDARKFIY